MIGKDEAASVAATEAAPVQRIEIVGERRRAHDAGFRAHIVAEAQAPGARVQDVARRHGICSSLVYRWRRAASPQAGAGSAVQLVPVRITQSAAPDPQSPDPGRPRPGLIEIEFEGGTRVRVDADVSLAALRRLVAALRR
jgi:transposase